MSQPSPTNPERTRKRTEAVPEGEVEQEIDVDVGETSGGVSADEADLRTLWLDSDDAGDLISSLSSDTARSIVVGLHEEPATASELADAVGTSVQNVRHHLDSLSESGLVEVTETRYSSKGREMDVYAPADEPMVVFVGRQERSGFVDSLKRFLGAVGVLAATSLLIQWLVVTRLSSAAAGGIPRPTEGLGGAGTALVGVSPGLLFFAGGALVLTVVSVWRFYRRRDGVDPPG